MQSLLNERLVLRDGESSDIATFLHRLGIAAVWDNRISFHLISLTFYQTLPAGFDFLISAFPLRIYTLCDTETLQHGFYDVFHRLLRLTLLDSDNTVIPKAFGNQNQMRKTDLNLWSWSALQSYPTSPSSSSTQPCRCQETKATSIEEHLHRRSLDSEKKGLSTSQWKAWSVTKKWRTILQAANATAVVMILWRTSLQSWSRGSPVHVPWTGFFHF